MKKKLKKRSVTLIEIMIVILLIGLIGGALAYNMRGSVDKGRVFKSQQNADRVYDALMMEFAKGEFTIQEIITRKDSIMEKSPFVKGGSGILKDGWGAELTIEARGEDDLAVFSKKAQKWEDDHATKR